MSYHTGRGESSHVVGHDYRSGSGRQRGHGGHHRGGYADQSGGGDNRVAGPETLYQTRVRLRGSGLDEGERRRFCGVQLLSRSAGRGRGLVVGAGEDDLVSLEDDAVDPVGMTLECVEKGSLFCVPEPDRVVLASGRDRPAVGREGHGRDAVRVSFQFERLILEEEGK